jgi:hypothetical protein
VDFQQMLTPDVAQYIPNSYVDNIGMDPTDPNHIVCSMHTTCMPPYDPTCEVETKDGGKTWRIFKAPPGTNWEENAGVWVINSTSWIYAGTLAYLTTDSGATWTKIPAPYGYLEGEFENHPFPRAPDGTLYLTSTLGVSTSTDNGMTWQTIMTGRAMGFTFGNGNWYAIDQGSPTLYTASLTSPTAYQKIQGPPLPSGDGCPYLDYDETHHILYASCFGASAWRLVMP